MTERAIEWCLPYNNEPSRRKPSGEATALSSVNYSYALLERVTTGPEEMVLLPETDAMKLCDFSSLETPQTHFPSGQNNDENLGQLMCVSGTPHLTLPQSGEEMHGGRIMLHNNETAHDPRTVGQLKDALGGKGNDWSDWLGCHALPKRSKAHNQFCFCRQIFVDEVWTASIEFFGEFFGCLPHNQSIREKAEAVV